jgi:hypothetical protein
MAKLSKIDRIKKDRNTILIKERAKTLSNIPAYCPFCGAISNLLLIKKHNKTKKCIAQKEKYLLINPTAEYDFLEKLNSELIKYNKKHKNSIEPIEQETQGAGVPGLTAIEKQIKELSFIPDNESYFEQVNREHQLNNALLKQHYLINNIEI